jgi:hypothetical protein
MSEILSDAVRGHSHPPASAGVCTSNALRGDAGALAHDGMRATEIRPRISKRVARAGVSSIRGHVRGPRARVCSIRERVLGRRREVWSIRDEV